MNRQVISSRILPFLLCLMGILLCWTLLGQHVGAVSAGTLCGPDGNCDSVLSSRWSVFPPASASQQSGPAELVNGTPVAAIGLIYFVTLASWFLIVGQPAERQWRWLLVPTVIVLLGCISAGWFIAIMLRMHDWCPLCLMTHMISASLAAVVLLQYPQQKDASTRLASKDIAAPIVHPTGSSVLAVGAVAMAFSFGILQFAHTSILRETNKNAAVADAMPPSGTASAASIAITTGGADEAAVGGPVNAAMTLVVFTDLQCGPCAGFEQQLFDTILPQFGNNLHVVLKQYPLCTDCNPYITSNLHAGACEAAYLAEAIRRQAGTRGMLAVRTIAMGHAAAFTKDEVARLANSLGVDAGRVEQDRHSESVRKHIQADLNLGRALGVNGTPSIYLDGKAVEYAERSDPKFWTTMAAAARDRAAGKQVASLPLSSAAQPSTLPSPAFAVGSQPAIDGPTLNGGQVSLDQFRGKPVVVEFWASWCHFCQNEMPNVDSVYRQYHPLGLQVVGISLDNAKDDLVNFTRDHQMPWPQIFIDEPGHRGWDNPLAKKFSVSSIPTIVLLDENGKVIATDLRGGDIEHAVANAFPSHATTMPTTQTATAR